MNVLLLLIRKRYKWGIDDGGWNDIWGFIWVFRFLIVLCRSLFVFYKWLGWLICEKVLKCLWEDVYNNIIG